MMKRATTLNIVRSLLLWKGTQAREGFRSKWNSWRIKGALIMAVVFTTNSCSDNTATQHLEGSTMGTFYTVTYRGDIASGELKPVLKKHLSDIEAQLSNWDNDSWISHFNHSHSTNFVSIPPHAYRVVKYALEISTKTNRALDPTLGNLINRWGFGPIKVDLPPTPQQIRESLEAIGPEKLSLKDVPARIAKSHPDLQLNVSSVAKGYASDLLAYTLEQEGITDYIVNIGGEMRISGHPKNGSSWKIAIQKPAPDTRDGQAHVTIQLNKAGLATSGDYRRFLEIGGQHYSHILDPETGRPVQTDLASATIIAPTSMQADGWATASMVLGVKEAIKRLEEVPNIKGYFILRDNSGDFSPVWTDDWPRSDTHEESKVTALEINDMSF